MIAEIYNKPDSIAVYIEGGWMMPPAGVEIETGNVIYIEANCPVKMLRLQWKHRISSEAIVLNDHWERGYGDLGWNKLSEKRAYPWYLMIKDVSSVIGIGVKTRPNAFCHWEITEDSLTLIADLRAGENGVQLNGRKLKIAELVEEVYQADAFSATCDFCKKMCDDPILPEHPVYGCNDWYCCYGDNSYDTTMLHTKRLAECTQGLINRPFMVIDDGWQAQYRVPHEAYNGGPWTQANAKFRDMKKMADDIKKMDVHPGIWMRPLYATGESVCKEAILEKSFHGGVLLDPSHPQVLEQVKSDIAHICADGYQLIKHDFSTHDFNGKLWGFQMENGFVMKNRKVYDETKTNAEIIKSLYSTIADTAKGKAIVIGCNTVSHLSAGYFEMQRTGDDTSGKEWERTKKMGINTLAFRMPQHGAFYSCDADCVGLTNQVPWEKNAMWMDVIAKSGTPLFVSIAEDAYGQAQKEAITAAFAKSAVNTKVSIPLDWESTLTPNTWQSVYGTDTYEW